MLMDPCLDKRLVAQAGQHVYLGGGLCACALAPGELADVVGVLYLKRPDVERQHVVDEPDGRVSSVLICSFWAKV